MKHFVLVCFAWLSNGLESELIVAEPAVQLPGSPSFSTIAPPVSLYHEGANCAGGRCVQLTPRIRRRWLSNRDEVRLYTQPKKGFWERRKERRNIENENRLRFGYAHPTGLRARFHRFAHPTDDLTVASSSASAPQRSTSCRIVCGETVQQSDTDPMSSTLESRPEASITSTNATLIS